MRVFKIIWILIYALTAFSQVNLIPNPGFEEYHTCPQHLSDFDDVVKQWTAANTGTPNYFNSCSTNPETGVPSNYFGSKKAYRGNAYVGIMTSNAFREYISIRLTEPLKANKSYDLSFYSSIITKASCNSQGLHVVFTDKPALPMNTNGNLEHTPSLIFTPAYTNDAWVFNQLCYKAKGGEQTLILGDFQYPKAIHDCNDGQVSYYFIDEMSLRENKETDPIYLTRYYCNKPFPFKVDGKELTGIQDTVDLLWEWDGIKSSSTKSFEKNGDYQLKVSFPGCLAKKYVITIENNKCDNTFYLPTIFTPNDDGINDTWEIQNIRTKIINLKIFGRSGQVIFSSDKPIWDGYIDTKPAPVGVYIFLFSYQDPFTLQTEYKSGSITLMR